MLRHVQHMLAAMRGDDGPPDFPGAVGATDLELIGLSRLPADRTIDDARGEAVHMLILGSSPTR